MAASQYFDQVQKLYIAYFGRPADPVGLNYWAASIDAAGGNFDSVVSGFSSSLESKALYAGSDTSQLVTSIYVALFNRPPEPAGLAYWVGLIDSNTVTGPRAAYQIMTSAGPGDATAIANKVAAANAFTANIDTSAELAGYSGASSAAIARAWLAKVDATPYSIANLTSDATKGVTDATGVQLGVPTTPTGPSFTATKDGSNVVTLTNAGIGTIGVSVTEVGGVYTFTNSGGVAGTATVTGPISSIVLSPSNASLTITSSLANGIIFSNGTIRLSDTTAVSATLLTSLEQTSPALIDATRIPGITAATDAQALALLVTNNGNSGNKIWTAPDVAVTLTSGSSLGATLKSIDDATTGLVNGTSIGMINSATVAQAKQLLVTGNGTAFTHNAAVAVALTDLSANAADINQIDASTTGLITTALTNINGAVADVKTSLEAITLGSALSAPGLNSVSLTNAITTSALDNVVFANNTTLTLANVTGNALTLADATVGAGKTLTVDGSAVSASGIILDGTLETNGILTLIGGSGADTLTGGVLGDTLTGGAGADTFVFTTPANSTSSGFDSITDFTSGIDKIKTGVFGGVVQVLQGAGYTAAGTGNLASDIASAITNAGLSGIANTAYVVTITGAGAGKYIYLDTDGVVAVGANELVIKLTGTSSTSLAAGDFIA
ncbi:hypothetical protein M2401_003061 [Pseudomonas sp. JUb42]|nr:hypothetical protein [Pseudomonas sp. JUb42]